MFALVALTAKGELSTRSAIRQAMLERFPYRPVEQSERLEQPVSVSAPMVDAGPDVVVLPVLEVLDRLPARGLAEAVAKSRPSEAQSESRLGTGFHEKDFGKVRAKVVTVLYVPIQLGFSW